MPFRSVWASPQFKPIQSVTPLGPVKLARVGWVGSNFEGLVKSKIHHNPLEPVTVPPTRAKTQKLVLGPAWSLVLGPWARLGLGPAWSPVRLDPWSLVPGPGLVPGPAWSVVPGPWSLVLVPWSLVPGPWSLVPGPWSGPWSVVPGQWHRRSIRATGFSPTGSI